MSRLAKKPIFLPDGINAERRDGVLILKGPNGENGVKILTGIDVEINGREVSVKKTNNAKQTQMNAGTVWSLVQNAVTGAHSAFSKVLELEGVGYRASMDGKTLILSLGFVSPVRFELPDGVTVSVEKNAVTIVGADKALVGQTAAQIRAFKKPEPYKGKGIHYRGEVIRRKVGKKAAGATTQ